MKFECSKCGKSIEADDSQLGTSVPCPACDAMISLEEASAMTLPTGVSSPASTGASPVSQLELAPGTVIGKCRIEKELGRGGMGTVYMATHLRLETEVALKILSRDALADDPDLVERFLREARLAARIRHPNVVAVMDVDQDTKTGLYFIVQEYIAGGSLRELLHEGQINIGRALEIAVGIAEALVAASELNIIHRDIKPANILLTKKGIAKLADLGLAKDISADGHGATMSSASMGTPAYMSLEQVEDARTVDARTDIYGLGASFYHMLVGAPPFKGKTTYNVLNDVIVRPTPDPRETRPDIPEAAALVCMKAMAKNREDRYQSPDDFLNDLQKLQEKQTDITQLAVGGTAKPSSTDGTPETSDRNEPSAPGTRMPARAIATAAVIVLAIGAGALLLFWPRPGNRPNPATGDKHVEVRKDVNTPDVDQTNAVPPPVAVETPPPAVVHPPEKPTGPAVKPVPHVAVPDDPPDEPPPASPGPGTAQISTDPDGAQVWISGKLHKGRTPLSIKDLEPGRITIKVTKDGFREKSTDAEIAPGQKLDIHFGELVPCHGSAVIKTSPPGARITVNGQDKGITPITLAELPEGNYTVKAVLQGHKDTEAEFAVKDGDTLQEEYSLEPLPSRLQITSSSGGDQTVEIFIDDKSHGKRQLPCTIEGLTPGLHSVRIGGLLFGSKPKTAKVPKTPGSEVVVFFP